MANEYLGACHALCFIENRKGISQKFPKIEEFIQSIYFFGKIRHYNSIASILVETSHLAKCPFRFDKSYFYENGCNSANNGSIRKILSPT